MRYAVLLLLIVVSCDGTKQTEPAHARSIYLKVRRGELSDSAGKAHFTKMTEVQAFRLSAYFREYLKELELRTRDPEMHYEAQCIHDLGVCKILEEMRWTRDTYIYMIQARTP